MKIFLSIVLGIIGWVLTIVLFQTINPNIEKKSLVMISCFVGIIIYNISKSFLPIGNGEDETKKEDDTGDTEK